MIASWQDGPLSTRAADASAVIVAASLPWSTSISAIATVFWVLSVLAATEKLSDAFRHPVSIAAIALFVAGAIGTLWSDVAWADRLGGLERFLKLLAIPLAIGHFRISERGNWILGAFISSCCAILAVSWLQVAFPVLARRPDLIGIPVKNHIAQGHEFVLCVFILVAFTQSLLQRNVDKAMLLASLATLFVANILFVIWSRTALIVFISLALLYAFRTVSGRAIAVTLVAITVLLTMSWSASPYFRQRLTMATHEAVAYQSGDSTVTSTGMRLEFWRKSLGFISEAPVFGHGIGSIRALFEREAVGKVGVGAETVSNPHNQILAIAIQLGAFGVLVLFLMWGVHLWTFARSAGLAGGLGLAVVVQNIVSSVFNSHLFDSLEGWLYVFGVGIAGGYLAKNAK